MPSWVVRMRPISLLLASSSQALLVGALNCSAPDIQKFLPSNATVLSAVSVPENGTYGQGAADIAYPTNPTHLPALCALIVNVTSSPSSAFTVGVFLPETWNSRILTVGNGGAAGGINWLDMGVGPRYGFASISTDTGHNSSTTDFSWGLNAPEKRTDFGWRALHGAVSIGRQIVEGYYGIPIKYSYYSGCSTGGRQGLKAAEMFPDDFDGILAGAPAWWTSHLQPYTNQLGLFNLPVNASHHIPSSLFPAIAAEVQRQCDGADGVEDGIISAPHRCAFNSLSLLCTPTSNASSCLTAPQLETLSKIYSPYLSPTNELLMPAPNLGSEPLFSVLLGSSTPNALGSDYIRYFLLNDPSWDPSNYTQALLFLADQLDPGNCTFRDFAFTQYRSKGKLILYHGLADSMIPTDSSTYLYTRTLSSLLPQGVDVDDFLRFFYIPGMGHCTSSAVEAPWYFNAPNQAGALGTDIYSTPGWEKDPTYDALQALVEWVEEGRAPEQFVVTAFEDDDPAKGVKGQRKICAWPKEPAFIGDSVDESGSWACEDP